MVGTEEGEVGIVGASEVLVNEIEADQSRRSQQWISSCDLTAS